MTYRTFPEFVQARNDQPVKPLSLCRRLVFRLTKRWHFKEVTGYYRAMKTFRDAKVIK